MQHTYDNELLYMIHANDEVALRMLIKEYEGVARTIIYRFQKNHDRRSYHDDLMQLARCKLLQAVETYRIDCAAPFYAFYTEVFQNAMIDHYRERFTYKGACDIFTVSLDMNISDVYEQYTYIDVLTPQQVGIPSAVRERIHKMKKGLSPLEKQIVDFRLQGYTYNQIAELLDISTKKVDNTLEKIRKQKRKE